MFDFFKKKKEKEKGEQVLGIVDGVTDTALGGFLNSDNVEAIIDELNIKLEEAKTYKKHCRGCGVEIAESFVGYQSYNNYNLYAVKENDKASLLGDFWIN